MKRIELSRWEPVPNQPGKVQEVGGRTAQEVFAELYHRLENTGYLPDEYFLLSHEWENGREIPKDADIFCTTDYGASEGIYLDIYLKWHEDGKPITQNFATGKTLGESEYDLDRMYLIASAITKAFHTDGVHARYVQVGGIDSLPNTVLHLNEMEKRTLIDSLIDTRNQLKENTVAVEQLLRRVTGSITEFVNEVGDRPLKLDDFDKAVIAIQDGNIFDFENVFSHEPDKLGELLVYAAGRPGNVGTKMTAIILGGAKNIIPSEAYLKACKKAIDAGIMDRTSMLSQLAGTCVKDLDMGIYGKMISHAMLENRTHIAKAILKQCTSDQIKHAEPEILIQALHKQDFNMAYALTEKGIDCNSVIKNIVHILAYANNDWAFGCLLDYGMNIDNDNYIALESCINYDNPDAGKLLLDRGMDFDEYLKWLEHQNDPNTTSESFNAVKEYWENEIKAESNPSQTMSGM